MNKERQEGEFHFTGFDLPAKVLRGTANHHAADEHADDNVKEHIDQTYADPAKAVRELGWRAERGLDEMDRGTQGFVERLKADQPLILFSDVIRQPVWVDTLVEALLRLATSEPRQPSALSFQPSARAKRSPRAESNLTQSTPALRAYARDERTEPWE